MERQHALKNWLAAAFEGKPFELTFAAADADFRRYFRVRFENGATVIAMDAPPEKMSVAPYLRVQKIFAQSVCVPNILAVNESLGFVALEDFGDIQLLQALKFDLSADAQKALLLEAIDELVRLQASSKPNVLPEYDRALMQREIQLFPDWFVNEELGRALTYKQRQWWDRATQPLLDALVRQNQVFVHRDFIVRNLMLRPGRPGILDFQDAVYGPVTYDLVSLLRDAFIGWEEAFVLDMAIRYWEKARAAGIAVPLAFDEFYRDFEWMGVQRHLKVAGIFARLWHRDGKDKYRPEIPRFLDYLRRTTRRYQELTPLYALLVELVGDEERESGFSF